ncbi:MAG: carbon-nitrogen hydrolase family protein [Chloroflexi bacterium]|nr:carbon-nitrogen hydrolase family protein [Chloroflexota bacterium]
MNQSRLSKFIAAAVQAAPILPLNKQATTEKVCTLLRQAAGQGARLVVFPETFIPMYPNWSIDLEEPNEWPRNLLRLTQEAVEIPGPELAQIAAVARQVRAYVVLGVNEKVRPYDGMLYNTQVFIGDDGRLLGRRRKLLPSNREKVFWHRGDGVDLQAVYQTDIGRIGGLICYEHLQPLFKYALMAQGEEIHCAVWPGWPNYANGRSNIKVIDAAIRAYALEGQSFVVAASMYIPPELGPKAEFGNASWTFFGGSGIINPSGDYIAGPIYDREEILYGEIDLDLIIMRKAAIDTTGRDSRWDVVNLNLNFASRYTPFTDDSSPLQANGEPKPLTEPIEPLDLNRTYTATETAKLDQRERKDEDG